MLKAVGTIHVTTAIFSFCYTIGDNDKAAAGRDLCGTRFVTDIADQSDRQVSSRKFTAPVVPNEQRCNVPAVDVFKAAIRM